MHLNTVQLSKFSLGWIRKRSPAEAFQAGGNTWISAFAETYTEPHTPIQHTTGKGQAPKAQQGPFNKRVGIQYVCRFFVSLSFPWTFECLHILHSNVRRVHVLKQHAFQQIPANHFQNILTLLRSLHFLSTFKVIILKLLMTLYLSVKKLKLLVLTHWSQLNC